eukprot:CAMPEP_0113517868 /NCGR_PEP_ID=MMETSP0014_2-20120614/42508_1 /TAXON_ID=2857 /ORGANISM="Nitzschia sp." /LENGTH=79 /DNA_ID=CAMNT_0000415133 /DNA_START=302 /DNA_END=541 /DNA_ORIENTATION=- /assembly_acc=CAM_ASM_000159
MTASNAGKIAKTHLNQRPQPTASAPGSVGWSRNCVKVPGMIHRYKNPFGTITPRSSKLPVKNQMKISTNETTSINDSSQ